jgi:TRAP-type C4-dicarboxylate transport system substrate-binding protein
MARLALLLLTLAAAPARAEPVTLKLGTLAPAGSPWHETLREMAERWREASDGQVVLRVYPGGTQGDEGEMVRKLGIGQLQAVAVSNLGLHDVLPEAGALSAPLMFRDGAELACTLDRVEDRLDAALRARGLVALHWTRIGAASFFCRAPYQTPAELARAKVFAWAGDPAMVKAWRTAGLHPVVLSATDLVQALSTGMVDCVSNVPAYMLSTRAFERAPHLIDLPLGFVTGVTVVRRDAWERIPADVRERLLALARETGARIATDAQRLEVDAVATMRSQGLDIVPVDPEAWRPTLEQSWTALRGGSIPADFFDAVREGRDACRSDHAAGTAGSDRARARGRPPPPPTPRPSAPP